MAKPKKLFIEKEGTNYVIKQANGPDLGKARTQGAAIEKAKKLNPDELLAERQKHTSKGNRDKWRKV